jgi:hypothetical protein
MFSITNMPSQLSVSISVRVVFVIVCNCRFWLLHSAGERYALWDFHLECHLWIEQTKAIECCPVSCIAILPLVLSDFQVMHKTEIQIIESIREDD